MIQSLLRIKAVMLKEFRQLRRDRLSFGMILGIPIFQVMLFGYAINTDVRHLRAAVCDQSQTQLSRQIAYDAQATQVIDLVGQAATPEELETMLRQGKIVIGLYIPSDVGRRVQQPGREAAQLLVDGSDPVVVGAARQLSALPIRYDSQMVAPPSTPLSVRIFHNPERRSAVFIVPGLIGVILTMTMVLFTSVAIVRERERGNLELLINTPVRTPELMVGKIVPYILIGLIQVSVILAIGVLLFRVPVIGSLIDIFGAALLFVGANLSLGLFISTLAMSQFQAMQMTLLVFLPSILLSGFMFPFDGEPKAAQYLAEILPLTHFVRLIRGIILRGAELVDLWGDALALIAIMSAMLAFAVLRFRKRLD